MSLYEDRLLGELRQRASAPQWDAERETFTDRFAADLTEELAREYRGEARKYEVGDVVVSRKTLRLSWWRLIFGRPPRVIEQRYICVKGDGTLRENTWEPMP